MKALMRSGYSVSMSNTEEFLEEVFRIVPIENLRGSENLRFT